MKVLYNLNSYLIGHNQFIHKNVLPCLPSLNFQDAPTMNLNLIRVNLQAMTINIPINKMPYKMFQL